MTCIMTRSMDFIQLKARHLASHRSKNKFLHVFADFSFLRSRKTVRHIRSSKVFFIMRGLPGSGKSTLVRAIKSRFKKALVCSADSFFVQEDGSYAFDSEKLPEAHEKCASLARQAAEMGVRHIVVDNTNILRWEMGKYFKLANEYGYAVIVVEPKTPWRLEPVELAERNIHGCTADVVEQKLKKFKAVLPVFWGWFFDETLASELLTLGEKYFDLCMRTVPEFASYMNELGVSKGLTIPLSFKEFYNRPKYLLHCTSFFSGSKTRSYGTGEYADCPEVQRSMGKAFDMKLVGIMFSPKTVGIRVILNKHQLSLWGAEDVWFPQPPPKPKTNEAATQSTDSSKVLTQDTPKMQKQKNGKRRGDKSKVRKRDENDTKSGEVCFNVDALDPSLNDMSLDFLMDMATPQSGTELAEDPTGVKSAQDQSGYSLSPYPDVIESASYQDGFGIEPDKNVTSLVSDRVGSEGANVQNWSIMALGENGAKAALCENVTTLTQREKSVGTMLETCCVAVGDFRTEDSVKEIHDLKVEESISYYSRLESSSRLINCQKHQSDIPADGYCHVPPLSVEDVATTVGELSQILSARHREELSDISAENICQIPLIHEENKPSLPVDKFSRLPSDSSSLHDHRESLISTKINDVNLSDFLLKDVDSEDVCKLSQSNISSDEPLKDNASNLLENSANRSASDICPEPTQGDDSIPVEGSSEEVPRVQLKQGSRAHITLGCATGYSAVQTGFDQMELLLCEDNGEMIGESIVTDDVEIGYYGEGRCTVYFDWPLYKSALFTGGY